MGFHGILKAPYRYIVAPWDVERQLKYRTGIFSILLEFLFSFPQAWSRLEVDLKDLLVKLKKEIFRACVRMYL